MRRWIPLTLFASCLGLMTLWHDAKVTTRLFSQPVTYVGLVPIVFGAGIAVLGLWQLKKSRTTVKAFGKPRALVTNGIYRHTRNPVYLGLAAMLVGTCFLFSARCAFIPVALFILAVDCWIIRGEERVLHRNFGSAFEQYCSGTRRWL